MPFSSEDIAITSEDMCFYSEEIPIPSEEKTVPGKIQVPRLYYKNLLKKCASKVELSRLFLIVVTGQLYQFVFDCFLALYCHVE